MATCCLLLHTIHTCMHEQPCPGTCVCPPERRYCQPVPSRALLTRPMLRSPARPPQAPGAQRARTMLEQELAVLST